jgi:hypothetical protein
VVYLALGVPVARLWHEATAAHRYCAEHHAMEEAPDAPAGPHGRRPASPSRGEQHESCPFTPLGGQVPLAPVQVALARPAPALDSVVSIPRLAYAGPRTSLLSFAPKTSPPA